MKKHHLFLLFFFFLLPLFSLYTFLLIAAVAV